MKWLRVRLYLAAVVLTALFVGLGYKTWAVQIRDGAHYRALGEGQWLRELVVPAPRGPIRDANGVELAVTVDVESVVANSREVVDVAGSAAKLAAAVGGDAREVEERLGSGRRFVWIKRRLSPEEARKVRELALPGIRLVEEPRRFYPGRELLGPVLGFAGTDGKGLEGVELTLDEKLRGQRSFLPVVRDRSGTPVLAQGGGDLLANAGDTVTLTIDRYIQFTAERALAEGIAANKAKAGMVVVLDPRTGDVLAMASWPGYDPNDPADARDRGARDRPVVDGNEPGSVMKVFSVSAALDAGVVKPDDPVVIDGGRLQLGKRVITDAHHEPGVITVSEVIKFSSNVGAAKIAFKLGKERLNAALLAFGFAQKTGVELPGESAGRLGDPARWGESGLATRSYGYGLMANALQIAAAMAAIADGGVYHTPGIVKKITDPDGRVVFQRSAATRQVVSPDTADAMRAMLKAVVEKGGTAPGLTVPGFAIAGKTGTAYKHDPVTHQYSKKYLASFLGFAPADDPRLVILVMIDEPTGEKHYGGDVAAPVFAAIAGESLKYLGIAGDPSLVPSEKPVPVPAPVPDPEISGPIEDEDLPPAGPNEPIVLIPDFTGLSVAQALGAARNAGVKLEVEGTGRAVKQFPPAGRALKSITCHVTFNPG